MRGLLHAFLELLRKSALERLRLNFREDAFLFKKVIEPETSVWVTFRHAATP